MVEFHFWWSSFSSFDSLMHTAILVLYPVFLLLSGLSGKNITTLQPFLCYVQELILLFQCSCCSHEHWQELWELSQLAQKFPSNYWIQCSIVPADRHLDTEFIKLCLQKGGDSKKAFLYIYFSFGVNTHGKLALKFYVKWKQLCESSKNNFY